MILYAKDYKEHMIKQMKEEVSTLDRAPKLAIIVAKDYSQASSKYVRNKHSIAEQVGIEVVEYQLPYENMDALCFKDSVMGTIEMLNNDNSVDGIIVQLPIPYLDENEVASWINPDKDVDGFNPVNLGKLMRGEDCLVSCTPLGILDFIKYNQIPLSGTDVCIVGRSNIVGKPLANLLINEGATVTICNSKTEFLQLECQMADIVITAIGKPKYFGNEYFTPFSTVIDVGINFDENGKMCGDVDFENVADYVENITPVPGGIGVTTVLSLMKNTIKAYKKK